jgi:hypothetical protein
MPIHIQKTTFELHPEGFFKAEVVDVQQEESEYGPRIKMVLETDRIGENGQNLNIWHYCSPKLSKKSKLAQTVTGILGCKFDELDDDFDLETLIGLRTQITVKHTESQSGNQFAKIESFLTTNQQQPTPATFLEKGEASEAEVAVEDEVPF